MPAQTHLMIDRRLCGDPLELEPGRAVVEMPTRPEMTVDDRGLVHGGFVFGLADHAAMLAVNDPNVVLGAAEVRFTAPVRLGDTVRASAEVASEKGRKRIVRATAEVEGREVFAGTFTCFVLEGHVLD